MNKTVDIRFSLDKDMDTLNGSKRLLNIQSDPLNFRIWSWSACMMCWLTWGLYFPKIKESHAAAIKDDKIKTNKKIGYKGHVSYSR